MPRALSKIVVERAQERCRELANEIPDITKSLDPDEVATALVTARRNCRAGTAYVEALTTQLCEQLEAAMTAALCPIDGPHGSPFF